MPTQPIRVDAAASARAAEEYSELVLAADQRRIVEDVAAIVASHTGMGELPTRGFFWQALRRWQQRHRATVASWLTMSAAERTAAGGEIIALLEEILAPLVESDEDRRRLREGGAAALHRYAEAYAARDLPR